MSDEREETQDVEDDEEHKAKKIAADVAKGNKKFLEKIHLESQLANANLVSGLNNVVERAKKFEESVKDIPAALKYLPFWVTSAAFGSAISALVGLLILVAVVALRPKSVATPSDPRIEAINDKLDRVATKDGVSELASSRVSTSPGITIDQLTKANNKLHDELAEIKNQATKPLAIAMPEAWKTSLDAAVQAAIKSAETKAKAEATPVAAKIDIWLMITHANALDARNYQETLGVVMTSVPRGPNAPVRVGLATAAEGELVVCAELDNLKPNLKFPEPNPALSESPPLYGAAAVNLFVPTQPKRRAVLILSASCDALAPNAGGWGELSEVHVVLIAAQREVDGVDLKRLAEWHRFVEARGGTVTLIGYGDKKSQNVSLKVALLRITHMTP